MINESSAEALSPSERRSSDRKKLIVDVRFDGDDATGIANTRDIGIGGLYMTTNAKLDIGTHIFMRMIVGTQTVSLKGVVAYADPEKGVGVRFQELSAETEALLKNELGVE